MYEVNTQGRVIRVYFPLRSEHKTRRDKKKRPPIRDRFSCGRYWV
jgi:hypothetical protein